MVKGNKLPSDKTNLLEKFKTIDRFLIESNRQDEDIFNYLSMNTNLDKEIVKELIDKYGDEAKVQLANNPSLDKATAIQVIKYAPKALLKYMGANKTASRIDRLLKLSQRYYNITKSYSKKSYNAINSK